MKMWRLLGIILLIIFFQHTEILANPKVFATVNSKKIGKNDHLIITYSFKGLKGIQEIIIPDNFGSFYQIGAQQRMVNNSDLDYIITLQPSQTGKFIIKGATAVASGTSYQTNAVTVEVVNGSILGNNRPQRNNKSIDDEIARMEQIMRQMMGLDEDFEKEFEEMMRQQRRRMNERSNRSPADIGAMKDNIFLKATVDKTKIYAGQPVTVTYKLYNRTGFTDGQITKLPELKGFYAKDHIIPMPPQEQIETYNGKKYGTFLIKKAQLFPSAEGNYILDPMEFTAHTGQYGMVKVASDPIVIQVLPVPKADSSIGYTGAVGKFSISQTIDKTKFTTDDIAKLKIKIMGVGNLDLIQAPSITFPDGITAEEPSASANTDPSSMEQMKDFTIHLSAMKAGAYTIPAYKFSYFNPDQGKFVTVETQPINIEVTEGKLKASDRPSTASTKLEKILDADYSKLAAFGKQKNIPDHWWFWLLSAFLLLLLPLINFYGKSQTKKSVDTSHNRFRKANKVALARLKKAQSLIAHQDSKPFYEEISKAVNLYISDKFHLPLSDLNKEAIKSKLYEKNIAPSEIEKIISIITDSEMTLYSPMGGILDKDRILKASIQVITHLEEQIS